MLLWHHNERDPRLIVLQLYEGLSDGQELMVENVLEQALGDAISVEDDASGLEACRFVELNEQLLHHSSQVVDDLLSELLYVHGGIVAVGVCIHPVQDGSN